MKMESYSSPKLARTGKESASRESPAAYVRQFPIGAEVVPDGGVHFRVWGSKCEKLAVELSIEPDFSRLERIDLQSEENGYFSGHVSKARPGMLYKFNAGQPGSGFSPKSPAPEPLLAPMKGGSWVLKWSSESPSYGGCGTPEFGSAENW